MMPASEDGSGHGGGGSSLLSPSERHTDGDEHSVVAGDLEQPYPDIYTSEPPDNHGKFSILVSDSGRSATSIDETLTAIKEKMWNYGDAALKGVAEVLVGFGISPTILGYSEEDIFMDGEGEEGVPRLKKDRVLSTSSFSRRSEEHVKNRRMKDDEEQEEEEAPLEDEVRPAPTWEESFEAFGDDKKDK
eukprot:SM000057S18353  [mRNA]  locus=s57:163273:165283:- [translate_table: standard]